MILYYKVLKGVKNKVKCYVDLVKWLDKPLMMYY